MRGVAYFCLVSARAEGHRSQSPPPAVCPPRPEPIAARLVLLDLQTRSRLHPVHRKLSSRESTKQRFAARFKGSSTGYAVGQSRVELRLRVLCGRASIVHVFFCGRGRVSAVAKASCLTQSLHSDFASL